MFKEIKNELIGKEMSFRELDQYMINEGYYSVLDDDITEDIKSDLRVVYTSIETGVVEVIIYFNIACNSSEDEVPEAFELIAHKITLI